jgi:hypothetical protein
MKIGDLVWFPCDTERYQHRLGVWMGNHDNPADVSDSPFAKELKRTGRAPRQVADILYKGKMTSCWACHMKQFKET